MDNVKQLTVNAIRVLSAEAIQKANSGHPGLPLGAAPIGYAAFTNMTTSSTDTSGIAIQAAGAAGRDAVLYNGAVNGWVIASDNASASAAVSTENWTGTTYYATGVTLGNGKTFDITVPNGANATVTFRFIVDASGNTTVTSVES